MKQDVQCFLLFAAGAGMTEDEKIQQTAGIGIAYYYGKLRVAAPDLDLADAVRQEAELLKDNPQTEKIGAACDAEISAMGTDLIKFGKELKASSD